MAERGGEPAPPSMRLDVFLWYARLARTRSAAQALAATGRLRLDGRLIERAHAAVRVGSILTFMAGPQVRALRVELLPRRRGPAPEAQGCYTDLTVDQAAPAHENVSQEAPRD
jgi:ribosome-associated heat shock protein Hsp15